MTAVIGTADVNYDDKYLKIQLDVLSLATQQEDFNDTADVSKRCYHVL